MPFDSLPGGAVGAPDQRRGLNGRIDYDHCRFLGLQERTAAFGRLLRSIAMVAAATVTGWRERAQSRRALAAMDSRMRRDIGLSRYDVLQETNKPFWRS